MHAEGASATLALVFDRSLEHGDTSRATRFGLFGRSRFESRFFEAKRRYGKPENGRATDAAHLRTAVEVLLTSDVHDVVWRDEDVGRSRHVDDVLEVVLPTGNARKQRLDGEVVEETEVGKPVVEEVDEIATVLAIAHNDRIVRQIERLKLLCVRGGGKATGQGKKVLEGLVCDSVVREAENSQIFQLVQILRWMIPSSDTCGKLQMLLESRWSSCNR